MTYMDTDPLRILAERYPDLLTVDCECGGDGGTRPFPAERGWCHRCFGSNGRRLKIFAELLADIAERGWLHVQEVHLMPDGKFKLRIVCLHPMDERWGPPADTRELAAAMLLVDLQGVRPGGVTR